METQKIRFFKRTVNQKELTEKLIGLINSDFSTKRKRYLIKNLFIVETDDEKAYFSEEEQKSLSFNDDFFSDLINITKRDYIPQSIMWIYGFKKLLDEQKVEYKKFLLDDNVKINGYLFKGTDMHRKTLGMPFKYISSRSGNFCKVN